MATIKACQSLFCNGTCATNTVPIGCQPSPAQGEYPAIWCFDGNGNLFANSTTGTTGTTSTGTTGVTTGVQTTGAASTTAAASTTGAAASTTAASSTTKSAANQSQVVFGMVFLFCLALIL